MKKIVFILFFVHRLFAQSIPSNGLLIQFERNTSLEAKHNLIQSISDIAFYCQDEVLLNQGIGLIRLRSAISEEKLKEIRANMYAASDVKYVNPLKMNDQGRFSASLSNAFVKLKEPYSLDALKKWSSELHFTILHQNKYLTDVYEIEFTKSLDIPMEKAIEILKKDMRFAYVSPNCAYSPQANAAVNDPLYNRQWALDNKGTPIQFSGTPDADMDVDSAWIMTTGDSTVKIAIIDSGTDTLHPDLAHNILPGFDATYDSAGSSPDLRGYPNTNHPEDGHGSCTAGIAAAEGDNALGMAGIAYHSKILPVRIFFYINFGQIIPYSTAKIGADGLNWATFEAHADILNNSWGLREAEIAQVNFDTVYCNDVIRNIVKNGRNGLGIPAFFSAGNDPDPFTIWPSNLPFTISVGATNMCDSLKSINDCSPENWGSNYGVGLDISAPGVRIVTTDIKGNKGFSVGDYSYVFNGTSSSCPLASGVMALMFSVNKNMSLEMARSIISSTCDKVGGYAYDSTAAFGSWCPQLGYGRINAYKAVYKALHSLGIDEKIQKQDLAYYIYINANHEKILTLKNAINENGLLEIYDVTGKLLFQRTISTLQKQVNLSKFNLNEAVYLGKISTSSTVFSFKFMP